MAKVKCAWFDFTSCEGCQIEMTNFGAPFLQLLDHVEVVEFREVMKEQTDEPIDIAFIEGSFTREADRARLESVRERSGVVVAYGSCATSGGINALKNHMAMDDYKECVYGNDGAYVFLQFCQCLSLQGLDSLLCLHVRARLSCRNPATLKRIMMDLIIYCCLRA